MAEKIFLHKILSIFILISFISVIFSSASFLGIGENTDVTTLDEQTQEIPLREDNFLSDDLLVSPNWDNENSIYGEGIHLAQSLLGRGSYTATQGPDGRLHCIWKQQQTLKGYSLFYSYSNDSSGVNWSVSELLYRFEEDIYFPQIAIDFENNIHIALVINRDTYSRVYYLNCSRTLNHTNTLIPLFTTKNYVISNLKLGISHNDTVNIAWIAKHESSTISNWNSMILLQRINITDNEVIINPQIMYNDSNPILLDLCSDYDSLHLSWTNSTNFSKNQSISHIFLNETTKIWNAYKSLTISSDTIKTLNIDFAKDKGLHILWTESTSFSKLYYLKWFTNGTASKYPAQINNINTNNYHAHIIEDDNYGDLHFIFEDAVGFTSGIYYRKMFITNNSWTTIIKISSLANPNEPLFFKALASTTILGYLVYLNEGSLVYQYLNTSEIWYNFGIIYYGTQQTLLESAAVDSEGVMHLVCLQLIAGRREILYMRKLVNDTRWIDYQSLYVISEETNPKLIIDSNDTLYIFSVIKDSGTGFYAVHYSYKLKEQNNWSIPQVCYAPIGNVPDRAYYHQEMPVRPYFDKPAVILDENNTVHLFWREFYLDQMLLNYAYKLHNETTFSSRQVLPSYQANSQIYHINAIFDQNNTLHLIHGEFMNDLEVSMIVYRTMLTNKTWTELELIDAAYDWLFRPKLMQLSTGKLQLIYTTSRVFSSWQELYYSDFELYEKMPEDNHWTFKETFMRNCVTAGYYDAILLDDDTLYLIYFQGDFSSPRWWTEQNEHLTIRERTVDGLWESETRLYPIEFTKATPMVVYNHIEDLIFIFEEIEQIITWFTIQKDSDNDTLGDVDETSWGTNYLITDTDADGLSDGYEAKVSFTNPLINDTDWDGLSDSFEVLICNTDPLSEDSDRDGVEDGAEVLIYHSNPQLKDSDGDLLSDYKEIYELGSNPNSNDTDGDLMPDFWEYVNNLDLNFDDSQNDEDGDGLVNLGEYFAGTDVYNPDTDSDNLTDGDEVHIYLTNPLNADTDYDTLTDWEEIMKYGTNPFLIDSDGDGYSDRTEIEDGTDPNDPRDNIRLRRIKKSLMFSIIPVGSLIVITIVFETNFRLRARKQKYSEKSELIIEQKALEELIANDKKD